MIDEIDEEEREFLERRERRRQRWMEERKKRERRLWLFRALLLCAGLVCTIVITVFAVRAGKRTAVDFSGEQKNTAARAGIRETAGWAGEAAFQETPEEGGEEEPQEELPEVYRFESNADTLDIDSEEVISSCAILVNADTDMIAAAKGAYDRISPASMTKVLTVLVAAEAIGEEDLDDTFTITREITDYVYVNDCSAVGFGDGETVTVRDLFYGTILPSGADAAVGLAVYTAGSHEAFVEKMNEKLEELGLSESAHFTNCVGLYDEAHYCTVYDMAVLMKAAMQNEWCREVLSAHTYTTTATLEHPEGITISNWFLRRIEDKDTGGLVVGGKTGFVAQSGNCAVSWEEYADGTPYICVTAGSTSSWRCIYDQVEIYNRYISAARENHAV